MKSFTYNAVYEECEGKERANYTILGHFTRDQTCDSIKDRDRSYHLITTDESGQKQVSQLDLISHLVHTVGGKHKN